MKKYLGLVVIVVLILCVGVSYSYFVRESSEEKSFKISSKDLSIVLTDNMELNGNNITPGWSDSKSFSVKNNSNGTYNYNIVLKDLVNTFVSEGYLQYKITSSNGYNMLEFIDIPKSDEPQDIVIGYDIDIEKGIMQEYTIEFVYRNSEDDQSEDMGKIFSGSIAIVEGTVNPNIKYTVRLSGNDFTVDSSVKETIKNGSVEFNVEANEGYTLGNNVECNNGAVGVIENNKVIVSKVTSDTVCELVNEKVIYEVVMKVVNGKSNALNKLIPYGESDSFTITPNTGYTLEGSTLTGEGCTIEGNVVTVSDVKKNGTCELTLVKEKYEVILTGSNVTVSDSPKLVEYEGSTTFSVSANTGFTMSNASVNCDGGASASISGNVVRVSNVLKGQTCTITPKQLEYDLTLSVVNGTGNGTNVVKHGGSTTFNVSASSGYTLSSPTISCTGSATGSISGSTVTISNVTTEQTCTVTLKKASYTVSVTSTNNNYGTVSPTSQSVEHGNSVTVTISPKTGYQYKSNTCGGTVSGSTMTISNVTAAKSCTVTFESYTPAGNTLYSVLTSGNYYTTIKTRGSGSFDTILGDSTATTKTIYRENTYREASGNNNKNVYYFAGNVADNWVEFAGYMWRIIRTNEDGGVRLLYHGTSTTATNAYIATRTAYNGTYNNTMYVGYMYGSTGSIGNNRTNGTSSPIKTVVDNWYASNINSSYNGYVSETAIYCNDRASGAYNAAVVMYYAAISRLGKKWVSMSGNQPSYQCGQNSGGGYFASGSSMSSSTWTNSTAAYTSAAPNVADKFSKSTASGGNGKLTYPVGLMTADEVAFAGGLYGTNSPNTYYYLNSSGGSSTGSNWWWTMSPSDFNSSGRAYVFLVGGSSGPGLLDGDWVYYSSAVRPVLSLKSCVLVSSGNGTASSPYKVELPSTCSTAAN